MVLWNNPSFSLPCITNGRKDKSLFKAVYDALKSKHNSHVTSARPNVVFDKNVKYVHVGWTANMLVFITESGEKKTSKFFYFFTDKTRVRSFVQCKRLDGSLFRFHSW